MRSHATILSIIGLLISSCSGNRPTEYIAPSHNTIEAGTEMSFTEGQYIYIINHSSVPIMITGLHLTDCENIKNSCLPMPLRIRVEPGRRENLTTVRPDISDRPYTFRFSYTWEPVREH
jgi:hypothetical protein